MNVVFDTKPLAAAKRRQAWRDAICEIYLQVDCAAEQDSEYAGFVREARFGDVTLTDTLLSPQSIRRQSHHLAHADKDCYYAGIEQMGNLAICQAGSSFLLRPGVGTVYYANEPYELHCNVMSRQFWIELPRHAFDSRFDSGRPPLFASLDLSRGLGRIAVEFCSVLAAEGANVDPQSKAKLGEEFMDILALALTGEPGHQPVHEKSVQKARLRSVKAYIDAHLSEPDLSLSDIAWNNGISLRYLHYLFRQTEMSASEWMRLRRLQRSYDLLSSSRHAAHRSQKSRIRWDSTVHPISAISFVRSSACGRRTSGECLLRRFQPSRETKKASAEAILSDKSLIKFGSGTQT